MSFRVSSLRGVAGHFNMAVAFWSCHQSFCNCLGFIVYSLSPMLAMCSSGEFSKPTAANFFCNALSRAHRKQKQKQEELELIQPCGKLLWIGDMLEICTVRHYVGPRCGKFSNIFLICQKDRTHETAAHLLQDFLSPTRDLC